MARIKISTPEKYIYTTSCSIRVTDLNYGNHLGNDKILALAHQARVNFFEAIGASEKDFFGSGIIMADSAIIYQSEGFLNNEIEIQIGICDVSRVGFDIVYQFYNLTTAKNLALVKTGLVCFNYSNSKIESVPQAFLDNI